MQTKPWSNVLLGGITAIALLASTQIFAIENHDLTIKLNRACIFRNGLVYCTSSTVLPQKFTSFKLGHFPIPAFGTFHVGYDHKDVSIRKFVTAMTEVQEALPIRNLTQLLQANIGRKVTIGDRSNSSEVTTGTLIDVIEPGRTLPDSSRYWMAVQRSPTALRLEADSSSPLVILSTTNGTVAISADTITRADFTDKEISDTIKLISMRPEIRMELEEPAPKNSRPQ